MVDWIADTTVLSNFAHVRRPDLLQAASGRVLIACPAVMGELRVGEQTGRVPPCDWSWLTVAVLSPAEIALADGFRAAMGAGESESLAVAVDRALVLVTDDADARRLAQTRRVALSGTVGVLRALYQMRLLTADEAADLYDAMLRAGFRGPRGSLRDHLA